MHFRFSQESNWTKRIEINLLKLFLKNACNKLTKEKQVADPPSDTYNDLESANPPSTVHISCSSVKNFPGDFSDLDGPVRQRRQDLEESSSSDSQTHDDEKIAGTTAQLNKAAAQESRVSKMSKCVNI